MHCDDEHPANGRSDAEQVVRIARSVLDGSTPLLVGRRRLFWPLIELGVAPDEEPFATIGAVVAHSFDLPVTPEERELWDPRALAREDARLAVWLPRIRVAVLDACHAVVRRFGEDA